MIKVNLLIKYPDLLEKVRTMESGGYAEVIKQIEKQRGTLLGYS